MSKSTRYMFFDTETTGLPRQMDAPVARLDNWPRVVQLAWILTDFAGRVISEKQFLIQPSNWRMQPGALRVHGISISHAQQHGLPLVEVLNRFALDLLQTDSVVGHNVQFDQKILGAEFLRVGQSNPLQKRHAQCTMKMGASYLYRHFPGWSKEPTSVDVGGRNTQTGQRLEATKESSKEVAWVVNGPSAGELELATTVEAGATDEQESTVREATTNYRVDPPQRPRDVTGGPRRPSSGSVIEPATPSEGATWRDSNSGFRYPSLRRLHRTLFGNDFDNAHNALADTQACMSCFFKMCHVHA
ncbi:MAG: 3'-5' exonuclease [Planctomycetaceae bacterium]|nr:3'-5' exonuclease [Planctomycetaceae bacterium]